MRIKDLINFVPDIVICFLYERVTSHRIIIEERVPANISPSSQGATPFTGEKKPNFF